MWYYSPNYKFNVFKEILLAILALLNLPISMKIHSEVAYNTHAHTHTHTWTLYRIVPFISTFSEFIFEMEINVSTIFHIYKTQSPLLLCWSEYVITKKNSIFPLLHTSYWNVVFLQNWRYFQVSTVYKFHFCLQLQVKTGSWYSIHAKMCNINRLEEMMTAREKLTNVVVAF